MARDAVEASRYEAGWIFFARAAAQRVSELYVTLCDTAPEVREAYHQWTQLPGMENVKVAFEQTDGYLRAKSLESDLLFLDPPFHPNADADWKALSRTCRLLDKRGIPFLAWYPIYWPTKPRQLIETIGGTAWEVTWAPFGDKPSQNLKGCGMLVADQVQPLLQAAYGELEAVALRMGQNARINLRAPERETAVASLDAPTLHTKRDTNT
jgi:23S rRNA A2030 N6-methylase RlmJ